MSEPLGFRSYTRDVGEIQPVSQVTSLGLTPHELLQKSRQEALVARVLMTAGEGFFLEIADPMFREKGARSVVPITITGTHDAPKASVNMGGSLGAKHPRVSLCEGRQSRNTISART